MKPGRSLEKLIAYLERKLAAAGTGSVESPKLLLDKSTGRLREHDVVITLKSGHHSILIAVECRDRSRPVGVPQLEAFAKKCSETFIDKGVIVSPCGFTSTALIKSKALGIKCLSLDQVDVFPWIVGDLKLKQFHTSYKHIDITIIPENVFESKPTAFDLLIAGGETITTEHIRNSIFNAIIENKREHSQNIEDIQMGEKITRFRFDVPNLAIIDKKTGDIRRVRHIDAVVFSETIETEVLLVLQEYKDPTSDASIAQLAIAAVDLGFTKGRLVINNKLETGGEVVFIPDTDKPK